jgi:sugar phosphate isomerase/epimerase
MRLGGPVFGKHPTPDTWIQELHTLGYRAAYCPLDPQADNATVASFRAAAAKADIVIAEVGTWSNPLSRDSDTARRATELCSRGLDLAERIGALCCVNIAGSVGGGKDWEGWDAPADENLTEATFDRIVASVRSIIDAVKPKRACYSLETMPYMYPDSPESYLRLMKAIDRPAFGVHFDPVNLINSPQRYYGNAAFLAECVRLLGPHIKSVHAKDITLVPKLTVHLDEARPGKGHLDYGALLPALEALNRDLPLMLEHLPDEGEYREAATYVRSVAVRQSVTL